jgi:hypothetical protein
MGICKVEVIYVLSAKKSLKILRKQLRFMITRYVVMVRVLLQQLPLVFRENKESGLLSPLVERKMERKRERNVDIYV